MFCSSLGSVSYPEPLPCTAAGLLLPLLASKAKETRSANAIQSSYYIHALCSQHMCFQQCLVQTAELHSVVQAESLFIWALCCISTVVPMCLTPVNHLLMSKWESFVWNIDYCLYTMPGRKNTSVYYFYRNKNMQKPDKTYNCIS